MIEGGGLGARYDFSWEILRVFLEGFSPIDLSGLALADEQEARDFLAMYGYDLDTPDERGEVEAIHREAVEFIDRYLCPAMRAGDITLSIPRRIANPRRVLDLLLWASSRDRGLLAEWSCAVLRVMHTISHANNALRIQHYNDIKEQILGRFKQHIHTDDKGKLRLGTGVLAVPLHAVFYKEQKSRESLILKLLHKPDNVAQQVHDRMGIKLVTPTKVDALLALKYLRKHNLVSIPNITPGRSRNTLVNLQHFRAVYEALTQPPDDTQSEEDARDLEFVRYLHDPSTTTMETEIENPFTSPEFRSIQFTCRQLVKVSDPSWVALQKLRGSLGRDHESLFDEFERQHPRQTRFFFPYEVQLTDYENYIHSLEGESSHAHYKRRQLRAARSRILGTILRMVRKERRMAELSEFNLEAGPAPSGAPDGSSGAGSCAAARE